MQCIFNNFTTKYDKSYLTNVQLNCRTKVRTQYLQMQNIVDN